MKRGNYTRVIVWGIIATLLLLSGIFGLLFFKNGYGEIGSIMKETEPLVKVFNSLESLKLFNDKGTSITSKAKKDSIVVSYDSSVSKASFSFKYDNATGVRILTMEYNVVDEAVANMLTRYMIEAISVSKGYKEGLVFEKFSLEDFKKTTPLQGASIKINNNVTTVVLNMDTSVLDANIDLSEKITSIGIDRAKEITNGLIPGNSIASKESNLTLHINMYETYYTIYIRDNKTIYSKDIYESLKSLISVLSDEKMVLEFTTICPEFNNINYEDEKSNIKIIYDSTGANAYTEFPDTNKVLEVQVKMSKKTEETTPPSEENNNLELPTSE